MATRITSDFSLTPLQRAQSNIPTHILIDCNSTIDDIRKFVELCESDEDN